jgi:cytoskeleton protein RodZ
MKAGTGLASFGEKLKQEREKRKITLEQISVSTKIGTRMLQALEEDKFNQLPGGIFNKGFVRAYARAINLDEDQAVADYLQASGDAQPVSTEIVAREGEDTARDNAEHIRRLEASVAPLRQLPWGLFAAVLLVVALGLFLWSHHRHGQEKDKEKEAARPAAADKPASTSAGTQAAGSRTANSPSPSRTAKAVPGGTHEAATQSIVPPVAAPANAAATDESQLALVVVVHAREESWIAITADGNSHSSEILAAGEGRTARANKKIIIKVGNAGGVDVRFNGKKINLAGEAGEVKTMTFGPGGIVANAAEAPSVP